MADLSKVKWYLAADTSFRFATSACASSAPDFAALKTATLTGFGSSSPAEVRSDTRAAYQIASITRPCRVNLLEALWAKEGLEWLQPRQSKQVRNRRLDLEILVLDDMGELVALNNHVNLILESERNTAERTKADETATKDSRSRI
ncbi:hypothetical protein MMYC01_206573 [Madurella mycetomatis]|uniref:Uncharacterized protein n=1 Tax=Madurella mycetomatis TaxID=100816 RepID=A0A175VX58_9PEZI|nr:hypothetical protein MMYC01_206573 [Madurella mycetomatis]